MLDIEISTDRSRLDVDRIHAYLSGESYWARDRPREATELGIATCLCFGAYDGTDGRQLGFARVLTDGVVMAWVADVFTFPNARGRGVGKAIMQAIADHPDLEKVKRMALITADAHGLYEGAGLKALAVPEMWMERRTAPEHESWSGNWSYDD